MSTEYNVNRVHSNFVETELKKIEPPADPEPVTTPAPIEAKTEYHVPNHVGETVVLQPYQTAVYADEPTIDEQPVFDVSTGKTYSREEFDTLTDALPLIEETLDNPVVQQVMEQKGLQPNEELLASFRALVGGEDFKVFRSQVIRAMKHQGVDTIRFFGE